MLGILLAKRGKTKTLNLLIVASLLMIGIGLSMLI